MDVYIFDIEESLVQANGTIDIDFQTFFKNWMNDKHIILVTSFDLTDTISQIGEDIWVGAKRIYQLNGNMYYRGRTGINAKPLAVNIDHIKSICLLSLSSYRESHWETCHINYFGRDVQTIQKLQSEWNTSNQTCNINQVNSFTETWNTLTS